MCDYHPGTAMEGTGVGSWSPIFWETNKAKCSKSLAEHEFWEKIPMVNNTPLHMLSDKQLVRFRGMIQDMFNPEFYLSSYEICNKETGVKRIESGKYKDITSLKPNEEVNYESSTNVNSERQTFYCVSIPGTNDWASDRLEGGHESSLSSTGASTSSGPRDSSHCKLSSVQQLTESGQRKLDSDCLTDSGEMSISKKANTDSNGDKKDNTCHEEYPLNFPIPRHGDKSCLLKVYDGVDTFLLNELVEVVGFLSVDPSMAHFRIQNDNSNEPNENSGGMEVDDQEEMALNPPPSLVPRIHVIAAKKLSHANPLLPKKCHDLWDSVSNGLFEEASAIRAELMLVLTQLLFGDQVAAEYLLCHLVSTIYLRSDTICLGQLCLNLFNIPTANNYSKQLYDILALMIPNSHYLPMTISNMNKLTFRPKKDYKTNRLTSGVLQLSSNTHLVLDETVLTPGQLDANGVHNVTALGNLISQQSVDYDFQFYNMEFQANIPVLILSEGKSLLPSDTRVKLQPDGSFINDLDALFSAAKHYLKDPILNRIRKYLTIVKLSDYSLSEEMQKVVQDDFVEMRKSTNELKISADDLHARLIIGRLLSLSHGRKTLSRDVWKYACELEDKRKARMSSNMQH